MKPSSPTVQETYPKETHNTETNKTDKYETMDTSYNKKEDEYEGMTLDSETSTPDPPTPDQVMYSDDEM